MAPEKAETKAQLLRELTVLRQRVAELEGSPAHPGRVDEALRASEAMLQLVLDSIPVRVFWKDRDCIYLGCNQRFAKEAGLASAKDIVGKNDFDLPWSELAEHYRTDDRSVMQSGVAKTLYEEPLPLSGVGRLLVRTSKIPLRNLDGNVVGVLGCYEDITEFKRTEEALREKEAQLRQVIDLVPHMIFAKDWDGRFILGNRTVAEAHATSPEDIVGKGYEDLVGAESEYRSYLEDDRQVIESGQRKFIPEETFTYPDGRVRVLQTTKIPFSVLGTSRQAVLGVSIDITEQKEAELALRESEAAIMSIFRAAPTGIGVGRDRVFRRVNDRLCEMVGYPPEEMLGQDTRMLYPSDEEYENVVREIAAQIRERDIANLESRWLRKDGQIIDVLLGVTVLDVEDPSRGGTFTALDITDRKRAEVALRESEGRFRAITENTTDGTVIMDAQNVFRYASPSVQNIIGLPPEEIEGKTPTAFVNPEDMPQVDQAVERVLRRSDEPPSMLQIRVRHRSGTWVWIECLLTGMLEVPGVNGIVANFRDVTERKRAERERQTLEAQVQQAQKLESLGVLAGGIAHDFNNLLTGILGNADLALADLSPASPARESLAQIMSASHRAADLCRQMLAYSGKGRFVVEAIDLNDVVTEMGHLLRASTSKKSILKFALADNLPSVEADATQIRQVAMNLIINASEAIGGRSGVIRVATGVMDCDDAYLKGTYLGEDLPEGTYVYFEVSDSGCGMDPETVDRIFDPFFTTKFTGRGLGLAAVMGIVRGHKGALKVYSEPDRGSTFKVLLPALDLPTASELVEETAEGSWRGEGTILLVDDEETVRAVGRRMLERAGFSVVTATNGRDAIELYRRLQSDVVCVLLDLTMPEMDGEETFRELRRIHEAVPVILSSGFNQQDVVNRFSGKGLAGFIQKPYSATSLMAEMRRVLEG